MNPSTPLAHSFSLLIAGAALLSVGSAHASLVTNGGFETGTFAGWTLTGPAPFSLVDGVAAHSGNFAAAFGDAPDTPTTISQLLDTQAGRSYRVSFWLQNLVAGDAAAPNVFSLNWDGGAVELQLNNVGAFGYTPFTYIFAATSASTPLAFSFGNFASYWDFDDVSAVREPASFALVGAGLLACVAVNRRRKWTQASSVP